MKKINLFLFFAIVAVSASFLTSCKSDQDEVGTKTKYADVLTGDFSITASADGGMLKAKAANGMRKVDGATPAGNLYEVYRKTASSWALVDGTEFLPGSAPALDWGRTGVNPVWFNAASGMHVTYCPILPLRFIAKSTVGAEGTPFTYLGISDITPTAQSFPLAIKSKRLGDKLIVNVDDLRNLPGYTNLQFKVSYTKSIIDVNQTALLSPPTSETVWPTYTYSSTVAEEKTITGQGDFVAYEGYDAKITGTVTISILVDGIVIAKPVTALPIGKALKVKLTTSKVGWYDSGVLCIRYQDVDVETVTVDI